MPLQVSSLVQSHDNKMVPLYTATSLTPFNESSSVLSPSFRINFPSLEKTFIEFKLESTTTILSASSEQKHLRVLICDSPIVHNK